MTQGSVSFAVEHRRDFVLPNVPFRSVPAPSAADAATNATFTVVDGTLPNPQDWLNPLPCLNDGKFPKEPDSPPENFRFAIGSAEGRVAADLGQDIPIAAINSYSCHPDDRAPQLYDVYGAAGTPAAPGFNLAPKIGTEPAAKPVAAMVAPMVPKNASGR